MGKKRGKGERNGSGSGIGREKVGSGNAMPLRGLIATGKKLRERKIEREREREREGERERERGRRD